MTDENGKPRWASIGRRLRLARLAVGKKSQAEFISGLHIAPSTYSDWESGKKRLSLSGALKLCNEYDISLDWLFRDKLGSIEDFELKNRIRDLRLRGKP